MFDVLGLRLPATEASRVGGPPGCVRRDGSDGWRSLVPRGVNTGVEVVYFLRQPSLPGPPTGPEHFDASWCGQCTRWQVVHIQTGSFSRVCSGTSVRSTRDVAASFVAAAVTFVSRCGDFGFVSRHKSAEHRIPDVSATLDVEASCITSCRGRRVTLMGELASGKADPALWSKLLTAVSSTLFAFQWTSNIRARNYLERQTPGTRLPEVKKHQVVCFPGQVQGCPKSKAQDCLSSVQGTRLPEVKSTRLLDFQTRHKVA